MLSASNFYNIFSSLNYANLLMLCRKPFLISDGVFTAEHNEYLNKLYYLFKVKEGDAFPCKSSWNRARENKKKSDYSVIL